MSNNLIERFLRNNLDDDDYKEYSAALDELCTPKRQWVSLTEWEREAIAVECGAMSADWLVFMEAVERALKEKNSLPHSSKKWWATPPPTPDWKAEYLKTVDLHCETLDELREAQAALKEARHANEKHIARIVDLQTHIQNFDGEDR